MTTTDTNNPRWTLEELRDLTTDDLMKLRSDYADKVTGVTAAITRAKTDAMGLDPAWARRATVKQQALQHHLTNIKNVLNERGAGIPKSGNRAVPTFKIAQASVDHAFRLLLAVDELVDACRAFTEADDDDPIADVAYDRMIAALAELDGRQAQWDGQRLPVATNAS